MTHPTSQDARMGDTTAIAEPKTHARYGGPAGKLLCGRTGVRDAVLVRDFRGVERPCRGCAERVERIHASRARWAVEGRPHQPLASRSFQEYPYDGAGGLRIQRTGGRGEA